VERREDRFQCPVRSFVISQRKQDISGHTNYGGYLLSINLTFFYDKATPKINKNARQSEAANLELFAQSL